MKFRRMLALMMALLMLSACGGAEVSEPASASASASASMPEPASAPAAEPVVVEKGLEASLLDISGEVIFHSEADGEMSAYKNMRLFPGDRVSTGAGAYACISVDQERFVHLMENTTVALDALSDELTAVTLEDGEILNDIMPGGSGEYEVKAGGITMGVLGTVFFVRVSNDKTISETMLFEGSVQVMREGVAAGSHTLLSDMQKVVFSDGALGDVGPVEADDVLGNTRLGIVLQKIFIGRQADSENQPLIDLLKQLANIGGNLAGGDTEGASEDTAGEDPEGDPEDTAGEDATTDPNIDPITGQTILHEGGGNRAQVVDGTSGNGRNNLGESSPTQYFYITPIPTPSPKLVAVKPEMKELEPYKKGYGDGIICHVDGVEETPNNNNMIAIKDFFKIDAVSFTPQYKKSDSEPNWNNMSIRDDGEVEDLPLIESTATSWQFRVEYTAIMSEASGDTKTFHSPPVTVVVPS